MRTRRTPVWMAERLRRSGIRPISLLVDVTQYVMLELGQPMHAFDRDLLKGPIGVRRARAGEALKLLDGRDVALDEQFLVVTDADRAVALAGVMGGFDTRVTDATRNVFLEAAHFAPERDHRPRPQARPAHRCRRIASSAASIRNCRATRSKCATRLIVEIAGGAPGPVIEAVLPEHLPQPQPIVLRRARLARVLGMPIADAEVERILRALGLAVDADRRRLAGDAADAPLRPRDRGRPDRGDRAHPRLRRDPDDAARRRHAPGRAERDPRRRSHACAASWPRAITSKRSTTPSSTPTLLATVAARPTAPCRWPIRSAPNSA